MPLRVSNLRVPVDEPDAALPQHLARALGVPAADLPPFRVVRKALDTRDKRDIRFVVNCDVAEPEGYDPARAPGPAQVERHEDEPFSMPPPGTAPLPHRPVVVGSGPGGLVCAYFLALHG